MAKTILITGASSGFGEMTAYALADAGYTVYASMRTLSVDRIARARTYAAEHGVDIRTVQLDVQEQASVDAAVAHVLSEQGRIDVLIHNAGHMAFGPAEAFTPEQFASLYDINVIGPQRLNRAALPHMRRGGGEPLIVWVGSTSTRGGTPPYIAPYFAAKAAMDSLAISYAGSWRAGESKRSSSRPACTPAAPATSHTPTSPPTLRALKNIPPGRPAGSPSRPSRRI